MPILPFFKSSQHFTHKMLSSYTSGYNNLEFKSILYYSEQTISAVNKTKFEISKIFPNPFSQSLTFQFINNYNKAIFELYDIQGHKLIFREVKNHEIINTESINSGIYLFNLHFKKKNHSGILMKE